MRRGDAPDRRVFLENRVRAAALTHAEASERLCPGQRCRDGVAGFIFGVSRADSRHEHMFASAIDGKAGEGGLEPTAWASKVPRARQLHHSPESLEE